MAAMDTRLCFAQSDQPNLLMGGNHTRLHQADGGCY